MKVSPLLYYISSSAMSIHCQNLFSPLHGCRLRLSLLCDVSSLAATIPQISHHRRWCNQASVDYKKHKMACLKILTWNSKEKGIKMKKINKKGKFLKLKKLNKIRKMVKMKEYKKGKMEKRKNVKNFNVLFTHKRE